MGFGFLAPMFLAGLAALAIPVLVHLVNKQDATIRGFPSLMFIQRAPSPLQRRRKIRHWALLALRCLALALMVLAFAQPFFERDGGGAAAESNRRDLVLLIDRSYSMGYEDHWSRAQEAALAAIEELAAEDRVALVYFDTAARISEDFSVDHGVAAETVESTLPGARPTAFGVGLRRAARLLADSNAALREILMISDFQRSGWSRQDGIEVPRDIRLRTIEVNASGTWNNAVRVSRQRPHRGDGSVTIEARVHDGRQIGDAAEPLQITVTREGTSIESMNLEPRADAERSARFVLPVPTHGTARGEVHIARDGLSVDNRFRFALRAWRPIRVLVVEGPRSRDHQSAYLLEALRLSEDPQFVVEIVGENKLDSADLSDANIVVFNEASTADRDLETALLDFVGSGGGLLVVTGAETLAAKTLGPRELMPTLVSDSQEADASASHRITWIEDGHPAMALFSAPGEVDLSTPRGSRYRALELTAADAVLARFDDGGAALVERLHKKGRVLTWSTTLDTHASDLPLQPVFPPLLHELMKYLADYSPLAAWQSVGDSVDLLSHFRAHPEVDAASARSIDSIVLESPSGRQIRVAAATPIVTVDEPGWYELHAAGERNLRDFVAVNVDPVESDLTPLVLTEFLASIDRAAVERPSTGLQTIDTPGADADSPRIWWYVLLLAAIMLATETLVSNRLSGKA